MEPDVLLDLEKSFMIKYVLNFAAISLSMYNLKELIKNSSPILLQSLILIIFIVENIRSVDIVETEKVSLHCCPCYVKNYIFYVAPKGYY
jgi:hypothetical protein